MKEMKIGYCPDCGQDNVELNLHGICKKCSQRKANMMHRKGYYIPYINWPKEKKERSESISNGQQHYQKQLETIVAQKNIVKTEENNNDSQSQFILSLRECGCEIPENNLKETLETLVATNKLKEIILTIAKDSNQQALVDLDQALNVVERKLQHTWEYNGFKEEDDIKFKNFLTWRRTLKGAIFFWKKLYETNTLVELQKAWNAYSQDPNEKLLIGRDKINSTLKRYQITTESISTILNTRKPFTRVFYATTKENAYELFTKWMSDRQLHENKSKTTIVELAPNDV